MSSSTSYIYNKGKTLGRVENAKIQQINGCAIMVIRHFNFNEGLGCIGFARKSGETFFRFSHNRLTQLLNCQWNSSGIDDCQVLKYQTSEP